MVQDGLTEANRLNLTLRVMFQDEARFGRINDPKRCWCRKGFRPTVGKQIVREYTYAYGAFSPKDGIADFLILPSMDGQNMNIFLEELSSRHKDDYILLFCDKAPCHKEGALSMPGNIKILYLPPYCPQLNPSENMWDEMREKFFINLVFDSMDEVEDKVEEAMIYYYENKEIVKSITGFSWIGPYV
ncbi:MAG: IS630 family transposase [Pedobacter sp.]|nr:IS630 family transposase [Pedobacter sp.]